MESTPLTDIANLLVAATALIVALITGVFTWRAYALQRQSTSAAGLDFLHVERSEAVEEVVQGDDPSRQSRAISARPYYVSSILSRGPGIRYGAQGAVWGKGQLTVLTPQLQVWGPDHPGIEFKLKRGPEGEWEGVYCGVVWESPRLFRKGFSTNGFRTKVGAPGDTTHVACMEEWNARKERWVPLKGGRDVEGDGPLHGAAHEGLSFSDELAERHPTYSLAEAWNDVVKEFKKGK